MPGLNPLVDHDPRDEDDEPDARVQIDYEWARSEWSAIDPRDGRRSHYPMPKRFIDGSMETRVVGCVHDSRGRQRPLILATVGAAALNMVPIPRSRQYRLQRAYQQVGVDLAVLAHNLPARELDLLQQGLADIGIALTPSPASLANGDIENARRRTIDLIRREMLDMEGQLLAHEPDVPTLVDGLLDQRLEAFPSHDLPAIGVVKRQARAYLPSAGLEVVYSLRPGQRTPAFLLDTTRGKFVTYYLRLSAPADQLPDAGIVRVAISQEHFEGEIGSDYHYLSDIAGWLHELRCSDASYPRAAVSLDPIVRAEEHLRAILPDLNERVAAFHHLTGLAAT